MRLFFTVFTLGILLASTVSAQQPSFSKLNIQNDGNYESFSMLDTVVPNYHVFFTGENHLFRKSNYMVELKMFKYLHQKAGVRHLFMEFGYSRGYLVNKYVQTGDSTVFKVLDDYSFPELALFYKGLYDYNKTLDSSQKIQVHGIDIERHMATPIKVLDMIIGKRSSPPREISMNIEAIHALAGQTDRRHENNNNDEGDDVVDRYYLNNFNESLSMRAILHDFDSNMVYYRNFLGEDFDDFALIVEGLQAEVQRQQYISRNMVQQYIYREMFMYDRFVHLVNRYPGEKFYAQFGRCHTSLDEEDYWCGFYFFKSLAHRISSSDHAYLKNKVLVIATYYPEGPSREKELLSSEELENLLDYAEKNELTLFQLHHDSIQLGAIEKKYQYIIINRNNPYTDIIKEGDEDSSDRKESKLPEFYTSFEARYGFQDFKFNRLNNSISLFDNTDKEFTSPFTYWGGAITVLENDISYFSFYFDRFNPQTVQISDSLSLRLGGYRMGIHAGTDITYSRWFNMSFFGGYGFSKLLLQQKKNYPSQDPDGIFEQEKTEKQTWKNPAFTIDAGLDVRINLWALTFGITAGYQLDLSYRKWMNDWRYDSGSGKTSHSGYYVFGTVGLSIFD